MSYFDNLFGQPEVARRENCKGREEAFEPSGLQNVPDLLEFIKVVDPTGEETSEMEQAIRTAWAADQRLYAQRAAQEEANTIDIDYEEVD